MTRPIKFRGRDIRGRTLFGDIRHNNGGCFMFDGDFWYEVDSDSIAQFVGYDKDGREIYEGDELTDNRAEFTGDKVTAVLQPYLRHTKAGGFSGISMAEYFDLFWGKELVEDWQVKLKEAEE